MQGVPSTLRAITQAMECYGRLTICKDMPTMVFVRLGGDELLAECYVLHKARLPVWLTNTRVWLDKDTHTREQVFGGTPATKDVLPKTYAWDNSAQ